MKYTYITFDFNLKYIKSFFVLNIFFFLNIDLRKKMIKIRDNNHGESCIHRSNHIISLFTQ